MVFKEFCVAVFATVVLYMGVSNILGSSDSVLSMLVSIFVVVAGCVWIVKNKTFDAPFWP